MGGPGWQMSLGGQSLSVRQITTIEIEPNAASTGIGVFHTQPRTATPYHLAFHGGPRGVYGCDPAEKEIADPTSGP